MHGLQRPLGRQRGRETGGREEEKGHCAWEAGTEARVPGGRTGLPGGQRLQGNLWAEAAEARSELEHSRVRQGSTGPGEHRKRNEESEEEKAEGVSLMDDILASFYFQLSTQCMVFTQDVPSTTLEGMLLYP